MKDKEYWFVTVRLGETSMANFVIDEHPIEIANFRDDKHKRIDVVLFAMPITKEQYDAAENLQ